MLNQVAHRLLDDAEVMNCFLCECLTMINDDQKKSVSVSQVCRTQGQAGKTCL